MSKSSSSYRPEIDGMRAIAVSAVILYHLKIQTSGGTFLSGGFLGVDLFFVLSGFLITGIMLDEFCRTGGISVTQFYLRRARRILPALLLVMLASLPVAWCLLLPSELDRFSLSLVAALGFVSNGYWFFELSEYGAQSGLLQPFLHTWSLAIEEQFYLLFPPFLILLLPRVGRRPLLWILVAMTIAGFALAAITTVLHPAFSFYTPTSRAWEMLAGAVLAVLVREIGPGNRWRVSRMVPALSLVVLLGAFATQDLVRMQHPGIGTVPVILATCGLIWCADRTEPVTRLLSLSPLVWVGKLSYSLYLWHFPIFAFGRIMSIDKPTPTEMIVWIALTFALSAIGYYLVERPFRFQVPRRAFALSTVSALVPVAAITIFSVTSDGATSGRAQALAKLYGPAESDNATLAAASWQLLNRRFPNEEIGAWNALRPSESGSTELWFETAEAANVLIIGDSLSKDVYNALMLNAERFPDYEFARFNLHRSRLEDDLSVLRDTPNFEAADVIMIAPNYYREFRSALQTILKAVNRDGKDVLVLGNTAKFDAGGPRPLFDWFLMKTQDSAALSELNALATQYEDRRSRDQNAAIREIAEAAGATYLSRRELVCPDEANCTLVTKSGRKTMYDDFHWTLEGAALFGQRAASAGWLRRQVASTLSN